MTTTTQPTITCPDWCTVPTAKHVADLDEWEGAVIHRGEFRDIALSTYTDPDGADLEPPQLMVLENVTELTISEARQLLADLARALLEVDPTAQQELGR